MTASRDRGRRGPERTVGDLDAHPRPEEAHVARAGQGQELAHPEPGRPAGDGVEEALPPADVDRPRARRQHAGEAAHLGVHRQHGDERAEVRGVPLVDVLAQVLGDPRPARAAAARRGCRPSRRRAGGRARRGRGGRAGRARPRRAARPWRACPTRSAAKRSTNSAHGSRSRSGCPRPSSWYQPQAISFAISGQTCVAMSTGAPAASSGSTCAGPRKRGSGGRPARSW